MRKLHDYSRAKLEHVIECLQNILYLKHDERGDTYWNPDKAWRGADTLGEIGLVFKRNELVPANEERIGDI